MRVISVIISFQSKFKALKSKPILHKTPYQKTSDSSSEGVTSDAKVPQTKPNSQKKKAGKDKQEERLVFTE